MTSNPNVGYYEYENAFFTACVILTININFGLLSLIYKQYTNDNKLMIRANESNNSMQNLMRKPHLINN